MAPSASPPTEQIVPLFHPRRDRRAASRLRLIETMLAFLTASL